jgi:rsbT co-antagonist protein RsbR
MSDPRAQTVANPEARPETTGPLREVVAHLRQSRGPLREEWGRRIAAAQFLTAAGRDELFADITAAYDRCLEALETGTAEALEACGRELADRLTPREVEAGESVGVALLLRDVLTRSLAAKYHGDLGGLGRALDALEPAANRLATTVAAGLVRQRERIIRDQQEAIRALSTPLLEVRERLLLLPLTGPVDPLRARHVTEQLLRGIRTSRARVVVIDLTGVPTLESGVANHLAQTVDAARLMGAAVVWSGVSPEIAETLVGIGPDLSRMTTACDLRAGMEEAERLLAGATGPARDTTQSV